MVSLIHPKLLESLPNHYPSTVTIQQYTATQNTYGEEVKTWAAVGTLRNLPCAVSAEGGQEVQRADGTIAISSHRIAIAGRYEAITPKMRAVSGGITYDILSVEQDSQGMTTSLACKVVT